MMVGVLFGVVSALYHNRLLDKVILLIFIMGISIPPYWLAVVFIFVFSIEFGWFPTGGMYSVDGDNNFTDLTSSLNIFTNIIAIDNNSTDKTASEIK